MDDYGGGSAGCGLVAVAVVLVLVLAIVAVIVVPGALADMKNADARRIEARENLEHQRARDYQDNYMMWTTALAAFSNSGQGMLVTVGLGIAAAGFGLWLVVKAVKELGQDDYRRY